MFLWICSFASVLIWSAYGENTCAESSYGTEFVFGFVDLPYYSGSRYSSDTTDPTLSIHVISKRSTYIYLTLPSIATASKTPTMVTKRYRVYKTGQYSVNSTFINKYNEIDSRSVIMIRSNDPISVLAVYNTHTYMVVNPILPVTLLTNSYIIPSYPRNSATGSRSQILVIALKDSTTFRIDGYDIYYTKTLKANETFIYQSTGSQDVSGTSITSNHPIAVFSSVTMGHTRYLSGFMSTRDILMQVPPIGKDDLHFIVPSLPGEVKSYRIRIYATHTGAHVDIYSSATNVKHMHVYENIFYEYSAKGTSTLEIISDSPIMVVQIALSSAGQAMYMTNIPAMTQYMSNYLTEKHSYFLRHHSQVAHRTPLGNYTVFTISQSTNDIVTHVGNEPFGLIVYHRFNSGNSYYAYGYSAGMKLNKDCGNTTVPSQIIG